MNDTLADKTISKKPLIFLVKNNEKKRNTDILIQKIKIFLEKYAVDNLAKEQVIPLLAVKSVQMNHLYQDLGFDDRKQMSTFMKRYFPQLSIHKPKNIRWKKYLYEQIGQIPPACETCPDQIDCFNLSN